MYMYIISSICISAAPQSVSVLVLWGRGLPTLGCLCEALPNIEKVPRPTGVGQKGVWELIVSSDLGAAGTLVARPHCRAAVRSALAENQS